MFQNRKWALWLSGVVVTATVSLFLMKNPYQIITEKDSYEEYEESEFDEKESGADKQLTSSFQSKGYPDPSNMNEKYWKGWLQHMQLKEETSAFVNVKGHLRSTSQTESFGSWTSIGPSQTIGGRVLSIAIHPTTTNTLYIGTASGGIWKTTTGGTSWQYVPTGLPVLGVASIVYNPVNPDTLFAGTGEVYRSGANSASGGNSNIGYNVWKARGTYGIGIIRSIDGGTTWTQVFAKNTSDLFAIQVLKYDPVNNNRIYACATDGLYRSDDRGTTWTRIYTATYVTDIVINPTNNQQILIAVGNLTDATKGIFRSTDGGASFSAVSSTALPTSFQGSVKLENSGSARVYASYGRGGSVTQELYMSTDFGATWLAKNTSAHAGFQFWFAHDLAINPTNNNQLIMGGVDLYSYTSTSTSNGNGTRTTLSSGSSPVHSDLHDIEYVPGSSNTFYVAHDGGMSKTINNGTSFTTINNGLAATQFYAAFATSPTSATTFIGGLQDNGVVKYNGSSWSTVIGGDGGPSVFHPTNGNIVLYSNDARAVFISGDAGVSETQRLTNMGYGYGSTAYDDRTAFMSPVAISKSNPSIMYVGSDNLHISTNGGTSFQRPDPVDMTRPIEATNKTAIALAVSSTNANKVYVSTSPFAQAADNSIIVTGQPNVLRSINASNNTSYSFTSIKGTSPNNLPDRFIMDFAISNTNDDSVFVAVAGFGTPHVYVTGNGGTTWTSRSAGLPDVPFNAVLIDPVNPQVLYAGSDLGVYVSPDRGLTWYDYSDGLNETVQVMDLQVTSDNKLVAATHGKGVFTGFRFDPSTLPVTFVSFHAQKNNNDIVLNWVVAEETDIDRYVIQKSTDGNVFAELANVKATASPTGTNEYSYKDAMSSTPGNLYYRLKVYHNDGTFFYSDVVAVRSTTSFKFRLLGNPVTGDVKFECSAKADEYASCFITNQSGAIVYKGVVQLARGNNRYTIKNTSALQSGMYYLSLKTNTGNQFMKFVKL
jgi:photosystem II stability/assembly factor-like uncharacterized protein